MVHLSDQFLEQYLNDYAERYNEQMVFVLLCKGAQCSSIDLVHFWSLLTQHGKPIEAHRVYELLNIFSHSGIQEYRANQLQFHEEIMKKNKLTIPYAGWCAGYFRQQCIRVLKMCFSKGPGSSLGVDLTCATPLNSRNDAGQSGADIRYSFNHKSMVAFLIDNKAHVNARDCWGRTALFYAVRYASPAMVLLLIMHGAKVSIRDREGKHHLIMRWN